MANNYSLGFYFELSFKGEDAAFQEVSGISKEMGVEEVVGGGENRFKYRLPTGTTSQNLILKRAFISSGSQLMKWCTDTLDNGFAKPIVTNNVSVNLLDSNGTVCKKWVFHSAYPLKYAVSDLKSQENEIVMETIELAYSYFEIS